MSGQCSSTPAWQADQCMREADVSHLAAVSRVEENGTGGAGYVRTRRHR